MNSSKNKGVYVIPSDIIDELNAIRNKEGSSVINWTKEHDAIILAVWGKKIQAEFTAWFKEKYGFGSKGTLCARYKVLLKTLSDDEYKLMFPE